MPVGSQEWLLLVAQDQRVDDVLPPANVYLVAAGRMNSCLCLQLRAPWLATIAEMGSGGQHKPTGISYFWKCLFQLLISYAIATCERVQQRLWFWSIWDSVLKGFLQLQINFRLFDAGNKLQVCGVPLLLEYKRLGQFLCVFRRWDAFVSFQEEEIHVSMP